MTPEQIIGVCIITWMIYEFTLEYLNIKENED